jgi:hypothetical protein
MSSFTEDLPFKIYSEAELAQKRDFKASMPDKMAEYLAKGGGVYQAVHGETHDRYVMGHCATPNKVKSEEKVRVGITINPEASEKFGRLKVVKK